MNDEPGLERLLNLPLIADYCAAQRRRAQVPGAVLGVSVNGERAIMADGHAAIGGEVMASEARFPIGCLIKLLILLRFCQLEEAGRVNFSDPVSVYMGVLQGGQIGDVTIQQLLSHSAGYFEPLEKVARWGYGWDDLITHLADDVWGAEPGIGFSYTQTGHCVLAQLLQQIDGVSLGQILVERILKPLGIGDPACERAQISRGHLISANGSFRPIAAPTDRGVLASSISDMHLSVGDLLRLGEALCGVGDLGISGARLATLTRPQFQMPRQLRNAGAEDPPIAYGLGLARYANSWGHNGSYVASTVGLRINPKTRLVAVAATNAWSPRLRDDLLAAPMSCSKLDHYQQDDCPIDDLTTKRLAGRYRGLMLGAGAVTLEADGKFAWDFGRGQPTLGRIAIHEGRLEVLEGHAAWLSLGLSTCIKTGDLVLFSGVSAYKRDRY